MWPRISPGTAPERGLTLLEVVVATAIFAVTVAAFLVLRTRAIQQTARAKNERLARQLAARLLEEIHAGQEYDEGASDVFDPERYPGFSWRIEGVEKVEIKPPEEAGAGPRQMPPPTAPPGPPAKAGPELRRYVVTVTYPSRLEEGGEAELRLVTYVLREPEGGGLAALLGGVPPRAGQREGR